jgi:hypothetical protein
MGNGKLQNLDINDTFQAGRKVEESCGAGIISLFVACQFGFFH